MRFTARLLASLLTCSLLGVALPLAAQAPAASASEATRDATARSFFEEGVAFAEHSDWEKAEDRFRRAYALRSSPIIGYNLATALQERRKLIEASELLRKLSQEPGLDPELARSVTTLAGEITPRIGRLTVQVEGQQVGDVVALDGATLLDVQIGVGLPVDPGTHHVVLARAGKELDARDVELGDGATSDVTLQAASPVLPAQVAASAGEVSARSPSADNIAAPSGATKPDAAPRDSDGRNAGHNLTGTGWFWTGVGAVAGASVIVIALVASSGGTTSATAKNGYHGDFNPPTLGVTVR